MLGIDAAGLVAQVIDLDTMTVTGEPVIIVAGAIAASVSSKGVLATSGAAQLDSSRCPHGSIGKACRSVASAHRARYKALPSPPMDGRWPFKARAKAAGVSG